MEGYRARDLISVSGLLSLARVPLAALFPLVWNRPPAAFAVVALAGLTDLLDGWSARRLNQETRTGALVDPITDKLFFAVVVATVLASGGFSVTEAVLIFAREIGELPLMIWLLFSRGRERRASLDPVPNLPGKLSTLMQFATIASVILRNPHTHLFVYVTAAIGTAAAVLYWKREAYSR